MSAAALVLVLGLLPGCGPTDIQTESPQGERAKLGDSLTLEASETELRVTPRRVMDPLETGRFDRPVNRGDRFVGVEVELENVGEGIYVDAPSNGATLVTDRDEQATSTFVTSGECGDAFASDVRLSPGSKQRGCIPFEISSGQEPALFQFGTDSGFGPGAGEWRIP